MFYYKGGKMDAQSSNTDLHGYGGAIRKELGGRLPRGRKLKVLDVGTGFGINVAFLARSLPEGSEVWTVDPSREVLAEVKAALAKEGLREVRFAEASADDMDFADGYFDSVVSVMVLHHIEKLQPSLKEMARVLKPGGTLVVVDYKPEASRELEFRTLHEEKDFFRPAAVVRGLEKVGLAGRSTDFGVWYLVEANRPSDLRLAARAGLARPRAARRRPL